MEQGDAQHIFHHASHPYTLGLLRAIPRMDRDAESLLAIPGAPPNMARLPKGCPFSERCSIVNNQCREVMPALQPVTDGSATQRACHKSVNAVRGMHAEGAAA